MKALIDLDPNEIDPDGVRYFDSCGSTPDPENIDHQLLRVGLITKKSTPLSQPKMPL